MAAKKDRTPNPPRTVQAPKRRDTSSSHPLSEVPRWVWFASVGVLAGAAIVIAVLASGGSSSSTASLKATMLAAGCTYRDVKPFPPKKDPTNANGGYHADVPTLTTPTKGLWSTDPPSAGAHYGLWAVWNFYTDPVNPRQVVHNEEHGAVVIWYGPDVPKSTVAQLQAFYNEESTGVFGTPYATLGSKIALTAWTGDPARYYRDGYYGMGHIAICPTFNQKAFAAFRDAYRGKGPEGIPLSDDESGMGPQ
jgi:hypothetical protein